MINRKQADDLLKTSHRNTGTAILEALYSGSDPTTRDILSKFPDLRLRLSSLKEAYIRVDQERDDYSQLVQKVREALNPELASSKKCEDKAYAQEGE